MAYDPFEGLIKGQDFVNGLFDQHARLQAGRAYAGGDLVGAAKLLASSGMIPDAQKMNADATTQGALTSFDSGDAAGALTTAAKGGDTALYTSLSDTQQKERTDRATWMGNAADALMQIKDPASREQAFQGQIVPVLKSMGVPDAQIQQIEGGHLTDESLTAFKTQLGQIAAMDIHKTDDGDILGIDKKTGQVKVLHHGTPKPIGGDGGIWSLGEDGKYHFQAAPKTITVKNGDGSESVVAVNPDGSPADGGAAPTGAAYDQIGATAQAAGANGDEADYLKRLAQVESGGKAGAKNGSSTGMFQFHPDTFHRLLPDGDINNPDDQTKAALALSRQDRAALQAKGVEASPANTYIMHQQGAGGGLALLTAPPDVSAVAALEPVYGDHKTAVKAIAGNIGMPYKTTEQRAAADAKAEAMPAGDFVKLWQGRWTGGGGDRTGSGAKVLYTSQGAPDDATLTDDAVDLMAGKYLSNGTLPTFGNGKVAAANKTAIINRATKMAKGLGLSADDLVAGTASVHALSGALTKASTLRTQLEASESTLNKNLDYMLSLAPKGGGQTGVPVFNRWVQAGRKALAGDPDVTAFNNAVDTAAAESAALMTRATGAGSAPTSDAAMREAHDRFDKAGTLAQLQAAATVARTDGHNRVESYRAMEQGIQAQLRAGPGGAAANAQPAPTSPSAAPKASQFPDAMQAAANKFHGATAAVGTAGNPYMPITKAQYDKLPHGAHYIFTDGRVMVKP